MHSLSLTECLSLVLVDSDHVDAMPVDVLEVYVDPYVLFDHVVDGAQKGEVGVGRLAGGEGSAQGNSYGNQR